MIDGLPMKEFAVFRGVIMMTLLLVSVYLVFSTFTNKMGEGGKSPEEEIDEFNSLLENFEMLPPRSKANISTPPPAQSSRNQQSEPNTLADSLDEQIRQEQDQADRKRAKAALMESVHRGEANRLLGRVAKPLLEKQDVSVDGVLPDDEQLAESLEDLVESLSDDSSTNQKDGSSSSSERKDQ